MEISRSGIAVNLVPYLVERDVVETAIIVSSGYGKTGECKEDSEGVGRMLLQFGNGDVFPIIRKMENK